MIDKGALIESVRANWTVDDDIGSIAAFKTELTEVMKQLFPDGKLPGENTTIFIGEAKDTAKPIEITQGGSKAGISMGKSRVVLLLLQIYLGLTRTSKTAQV